MKHLFKLAIGLLFLTLLGCEDMIELEKQSYVVAIGVDLTDVEGLFQFTFLIAEPSTRENPSEDSRMAEQTIGIASTDLIVATDIANNFVSKKINLDHTRVIIVSEELARNGEFTRVIQPSAQTTKMRRNIQIIVTRENAETFLRSVSPSLVESPHRYFQFMLTRANETGVIPDADLHRFFQITEGQDELFLAVYASTIQVSNDLTKPSIEKKAGELVTTGGNPAEFMGSAVFKNGKMIDVLNAQETRMANKLDKTSEMDDIISGIPDPVDPVYNISGKYSQVVNPSLDIQYDKVTNHAKIHILIPFEFETVAIPSIVPYPEDKELEELLKKSLEEHYNKVAKDLIDKTQQVYKSEPFYWSLFIRPFFKDIPSFEEANWSEVIYPNADINVEFKIQRIEFGKSLYDTNFNEVSD